MDLNTSSKLKYQSFVFGELQKDCMLLIKPIQNDKVFNSTCKDKSARDVITWIKINMHTGFIENKFNVSGEFALVRVLPLWN